MNRADGKLGYGVTGVGYGGGGGGGGGILHIAELSKCADCMTSYTYMSRCQIIVIPVL